MTVIQLGASEQFARRIFTRGTDIFGPKELADVFKINMPESEVPPIPFSEEELIRARELGQILVLQAPAVTMSLIHGCRSNKTSDEKPLFYDTNWYKEEGFFLEETVRTGWRLATREVIPDSRRKNYLEQTQTIIDYLRNQVFKGMSLPAEAEVAIAEFEVRKKNLKKLLDSDWKKAAEELSNLQINRLYRDRQVETTYRLALYEAVNHERLLPEGNYNWTNSRSSGGSLIYSGRFVPSGLVVGRGGPGDSDPCLGVCFSRGVGTSEN